MRIRSLLAERFSLRTHQESRNLPVYRLIVGSGGSRVEGADSSSAPAGIRAGPGTIIASGVKMEQFIVVLSRYLDRPLIDRTGVTGLIRAKLQFAPESAPPQGVASDDPSLFTAIQEQLGLKVEAGQERFQVLVIDHVERPSAN